MDPTQKRELKRQASLRLAAQRRRAGLLRGRVLALSLICFVVLWGIVFAQMTMGDDPVLNGKEGPTTTRTPASSEQARPREREAVIEAEPEREPEEFDAEPEVEETEPESIEEPLVTSQS